MLVVEVGINPLLLSFLLYRRSSEGDRIVRLTLASQLGVPRYWWQEEHFSRFTC